MNIREAHFAFKIAFDRIDSLSTPDFNQAEVDAFLNEAQLIFIKRRYGKLSNPKRKGFEETQKRTDDLSTVSISYPLEPAIVPTEIQNLIYKVSTDNFTYPYMFLTGIRGVSDDADCSNIQFKQIRMEELADKLLSPFSGNTAYYMLSRGDNDEAAIYFHASKKIKEVYVSYIKHPSKVSTGNYIHLDGVVYPENSFELPTHTHPEIVDIAAELAALSIQDPAYINTKNQKVLVHE